MGFKFGRGGLILVMVAASVVGVSLGNKDLGRQSHTSSLKESSLVDPKTGVLASTTPIVFKYDAPSKITFPHNVYLLPNLKSFLNCDLRRGKVIANPTQGSGNGFEFVLKKRKPYYLACGERNGFHCKVGLMKFAVVPMRRRHH
ncbi:putative CUB and sushi domain-containing protein 3 [Hibiscus syriacus]|uniref:CUB and sushi domain-containing protein 3 n=1 Tax=Hibiscus syriacus TaxID=106335 RepID=A0A6A3BVD7_HIBSY|nr:putative CUB and sushi domain-containing protein 3 [Hibiscus syriacus]